MKNTWDQRYDRKDYYYGTEPNFFLASQKDLFFKNAKVLCLAEGEGRNAVFLSKLGCCVTAIDSSQVGLNKLKLLALENNVEIVTICADLKNFEIKKDEWDFVISIWCHIPSELRRKLHSTVAHNLKENGYLILEAYTPDQIPLKTGGPTDPDLLPTQNLLKEELLGLNIKIARELIRPIYEGIGHQGNSAVVQIIAQKDSR